MEYIVCSDVFIFLASKFQLVLKPSDYCMYEYILELCVLPTECVCVFRWILTINSINRLRLVEKTR
jgi:hypothetical protein